MSCSKTGVTLGVLMLLSVCPPLVREAQAQETHTYADCPGPVADAAVAAAKAAFQAGQASFNEADYARAIVYWEDALRRDCNANPLLLNLARAYELHGEKEQAVIALETYLERVPDDPQSASIKRRIAVLVDQIEESKAQASTAPKPAPKPERKPPPPVETSAEDAPAAEAPSSERPLWPLFIAGGGTVVAVTGFVLAGVAHSDVARFEESCPENPTTGTHDCPDDGLEQDGNDARSRRSVGLGVGIAGAVIAGAGVAWYFLQPGDDDSTAGIELGRGGPRLNAGFGPSMGQLSLSGVF